MSESLLTRPLLQNAECTVLTSREVTLPAGVWTVICERNVNRLAFTAHPDMFGSPPFISNVPYGTGAILGASAGFLPMVVHGSVYPLWITGQWWGYSSGGANLTISELIRNEGV